jgi:hypothetical protein
VRHPFLRTLAGSAAPAATDPNFENVTLLLHGDGTNGGQNNTFVDGSTNNFTITRNGNTTQGTFSPYGDNWSNYFDGTGDYFNIADNAALDFGTGDFTIDLWFYAESVADAVFAAGFSSGSPVSGWGASVYAGSASFTIAVSDTYVGVSNSATISANTWYHYAIVRSGNSFTLYINGVGGTAVTNTSSINTQAAGLNIGRSTYTLNLRQFKGYISNLRIVKGTAVYTSNFTPSTIPLTAITNTSLLTCQSNRFRDASTNNFTITRNGDVSVQRFSPFSPTAAYAAGTIGGSGYFDGTGDNIYVSSATGLCDFPSGGAFTFQVWLYRLSTAEMLFIQGGANTFQVSVTSSGGGWSYSKAGVANVFFGVGSAPIGAWTHCTLCRDTSNRTRMWVNGVSVASSTTDTFAFNTAATYIGSNNTSNAGFVNGYLSDMRILKGQALYDPTSSANIPVPTAPLTAVTNTSFLLNFTNAAILDNAMMAVPETVGNAQIDTTTKKFGTGSLKFDGSGDWLRVQGTPNLFNLSTGDFTIECWFYAVSTGTSAIVQQGTTDWRISYTNSGVMRYEVGANSIQTSTGAFSFNTWTHLAICKSGATTTLYLDGTSRVTTTNSPTNSGNPVYVGANIDGGSPFWPLNGYIDDLRITKGVARYTANFTPPTEAFPDL